METSNLLYREHYPGYMGHIPLKNETIGLTVGNTNQFIKNFISKPPPSEDILVSAPSNDYSKYNKDYFNQNFSREYKLEEDNIYKNTSKNANTWICGTKYEIYPQHIPGYKAHVPHIYSENIFGISYSKSTAKAIKRDISIGHDYNPDQRYRTMTKLYFDKPKIRDEVPKKISEEERKNEEEIKKMMKTQTAVLRSKIADIPTPGYSGHTTIFRNPVSYMNKEKLTETELKASSNSIKNKIQSQDVLFVDQSGDPKSLASTYAKVSKPKVEDEEELPYICGYKGFRTGVKSNNMHGRSFRDISYDSVNRLKSLQKS